MALTNLHFGRNIWMATLIPTITVLLFSTPLFNR